MPSGDPRIRLSSRTSPRISSCHCQTYWWIIASRALLIVLQTMTAAWSIKWRSTVRPWGWAKKKKWRLWARMLSCQGSKPLGLTSTMWTASRGSLPSSQIMRAATGLPSHRKQARWCFNLIAVLGAKSTKVVSQSSEVVKPSRSIKLSTTAISNNSNKCYRKVHRISTNWILTCKTNGKA